MRRQPDFVLAPFQHLARKIRIIQRQAADAGKIGARFIHHRAQIIWRDQIGRANQRHVDALGHQQAAQRWMLSLLTTFGV